MCLVLVILASLATTARADLHYSMLLSRPAPERNWIFSVNTTTGQLTVQSLRLAVVLDPLGAAANSLSLGYGTHDNQNWHGALLWSVAPGSKGIYPSDLFFEPVGDRRSDLYISPHVPYGFLEMNLKGAEENSDDLPVPVEQLLATGTLQIPGGFTGQPVAGNPDDLIGFDLHTTPNFGKVYFTAAAPFVAADGTPHLPSEVLYLDRISGTDQIVGWLDATDLGIDANDRIDALDVDAAYSASRGQTSGLIFSISADSPSVVSGTMDAAAIYYHQIGTTGHQLHRTSLAAGTIPDDSDIDCIVSIDPSTNQSSPPVDVIVSPTGEVSVMSSSASEPVVLWDFRVETLDSTGHTSSTLDVGDVARIDVYYEHQGRIRGHHELISRPGNDQNPLQFVEVTATTNLAKIVLGPPQPVGDWEFVIDGESTFTSAIEELVEFELEPGTHLIHVHYCGNPARRSDPRTVVAHVRGARPRPTGLTSTGLPTDPIRYRFGWDFDAAETPVVEIEQDGETTLSLGQMWSTGDLPVGVHRTRIRRGSGLDSSFPVTRTVCVSPPPTSSPILPGPLPVAGSPGDATWLDSRGEVIFVDSASSSHGYLRYSVNGLSAVADGIAALSWSGELRAVATIPRVELNGDLTEHLLWLTDSSIFVETDELGNFYDLGPWPASLSAVTSMTYDADRDRLLVVDGGEVHAVHLSNPIAMAVPTTEMLAGPSVGNVTQVTMTEHDYYEIVTSTVLDGSVTDLVTVDARTDTVVASIALQPMITGSTGIAYVHHGTGGRPEYTIATPAGIEIYRARDPRVVQPLPSGTGVTGVWTEFGDLDGDGVSFTPADLAVAIYLLGQPGESSQLLCEATLDINQDGVINADDTAIYLAGFALTAPIDTCLPVVTPIPCEQPYCGP
ncbi:MAG: hypothetical protein KDC38_10690 [Planctomycetes bacterium]|nr:hypothetical protein [Planctomycetota bacterium]